MYLTKNGHLKDIPRKSRIHNLIKSGNVDFIDIQVKKNIDDENIFDVIQVISNNKSKQISFAIKKKGYDNIFNCYNSSKTQLKEIFLCSICHDTFKNSGGNAARHSMHSFKSK